MDRCYKWLLQQHFRISLATSGPQATFGHPSGNFWASLWQLLGIPLATCSMRQSVCVGYAHTNYSKYGVLIGVEHIDI